MATIDYEFKKNETLIIRKYVNLTSFTFFIVGLHVEGGTTTAMDTIKTNITALSILPAILIRLAGCSIVGVGVQMQSLFLCYIDFIHTHLSIIMSYQFNTFIFAVNSK